jgi:hypothetical protein
MTLVVYARSPRLDVRLAHPHHREELRARDVPGSFDVENELAVEKSQRKSTNQ